jgi:Holliday junction resolvasome RuvABC endonuclease subunit
MNILALDLGTTTGWCISNLNSRGVRQQQSGSESFRPRSAEGAGMRYLKFQRFLDELAKSGLDWVAFEEVKQRPKSAAAGHVYGGFMATLTAWCEANAVPYEPIPSGTIKKHWTGKGNAGKEIMLAVAHRRGYTPADDNEADALALHELMLHRINKNETARVTVQRPAPDGKPTARVPVGPVPLARKRVRIRKG